jgi:hypothetical protein
VSICLPPGSIESNARFRERVFDRRLEAPSDGVKGKSPPLREAQLSLDLALGPHGPSVSRRLSGGPRAKLPRAQRGQQDLALHDLDQARNERVVPGRVPRAVARPGLHRLRVGPRPTVHPVEQLENGGSKRVRHTANGRRREGGLCPTSLRTVHGEERPRKIEAGRAGRFSEGVRWRGLEPPRPFKATRPST